MKEHECGLGLSACFHNYRRPPNTILNSTYCRPFSYVLVLRNPHACQQACPLNIMVTHILMHLNDDQLVAAQKAGSLLEDLAKSVPSFQVIDLVY